MNPAVDELSPSLKPYRAIIDRVFNDVFHLQLFHTGIAQYTRCHHGPCKGHVTQRVHEDDSSVCLNTLLISWWIFGFLSSPCL
jgi:hypothetical protein